MKEFLCGLLVVLLAGAAHCREFSIRPSAYETYGDYTDSRWSVEHAGYVTLSKKELQFLTVGFSDLHIAHPAWKYHEQMPVGGILLSRLPFRVKAYYAHIAGNYTSKDGASANYSDKADVGSIEVIYSKPLYELGLDYTRFSGSGLSYADSLAGRMPQQRADQFTGRITCVLNPRFSLTARHSFVQLRDGRKLYSLAMKAVYAPRPKWILAAGGFIGERAYYFDNDLLVIFDQNDTQRGMVFGQVEARVWKSVSLTAEYIYTQFDYYPIYGIPGEDYSIRYLVAGIKSRFPF
jgi:hypothetical protein